MSSRKASAGRFMTSRSMHRPSGTSRTTAVRNNLLTYYRDEIVKAALPAIVNSLAPGGYLVIGRKEKLPDSLEGFCRHRSVSCLYRKQGSNG